MDKIILLFWIHFIADFFLQNTYMAMNKSESVKALSLHCLVYSLPFICFGWKFALLAGVLHFPIDYITSKITSMLYTERQYHWFFVVIGFDQAIHMTVLYKTLIFLS